MGVSYPANNSKIKRTSNLGFIHKYIPNKRTNKFQIIPLTQSSFEAQTLIIHNGMTKPRVSFE